MTKYTSYSMTAIAGFCILSTVYAGCGNEEAFLEYANNLPGRCAPTKDPSGCQLVYQCGDNEIEYVPLSGNTCSRSGDAPDKPSGKCAKGECKLACLVDKNCMCSSEKPCAEVECYTATCNGICEYTQKIAGQNEQTIACKLADGTTNGYCNSAGICVECVNTADCMAQFKYCDNETCLPLIGLGEACTNSYQCRSGHCKDAVCVECITNDDCEGISLLGFEKCTANRCLNKVSGQTCSGPNECVLNNCVDGVCCLTKCDGPCYSCNNPGSPGLCTGISVGAADLECDQGTGCGKKTPAIDYMECIPGKVNGALCTMNGECISKCCTGPSNKRLCTRNDEPCDDNTPCNCGMCVNGKCV